MNASSGSGLYDPSVLPASWALGLNFSDGAWAGIPGALSNDPFSQGFTVAGTKVTPVLPNAQSVTLSFNPKAGLFNGTFKDLDANGKLRNVPFQATVLTGGGSPNVFGRFIMPNTVQAPAYYIGGSVSGF